MDLHQAQTRVSPKNVSASDLKSDAIFSTMKSEVSKDPAAAKAINAVFVYNITKGGNVAKKWSKFYLLLTTYLPLC